MNRSKPVVHYLKDYRPADFVIESVFINFDLGEEQTHVKTILNCHRNSISKDKNAVLVLNGEQMELQSVRLDGELLSQDQYQVDAESLRIPGVPEKFTLETEVIIQPQKNTTLMGLYKSRNNFCTQCESHGFRRITYYLDRPDVMSKFTTTITADKTKYPTLLSNGNLIEAKELDNNRHWVHWEDPSLKPAYLFALVAGDFDFLQDTFTTMSDRKVDLHLYLEKGCKDQGHYALASLKRAMRWDEERFGREYDLDIYMIVAVSDFNMGAMENKGLNIFNTKYVLAKPETATDADYVAIEGVIGHEYFHNWSGNRVTCRDWFQITLKEGLTVFRDQSFTEDMTSKAVARLDTANVVRTQQFSEDAGPLAHPIRPDSYIEINNFYTVTVYRKGAEIIRMVQTLITPELFRKGMDLYFHRYDGHAVTTEDFIKAMEDASGKDLTQFRRWYSQAGTPVLDIEDEYDSKNQTYTLKVKQTCPATPGQPKKEPFHLPLSVGLIGPECDDLAVQLQGESAGITGTRVLEIKDQEQQFVFTNLPKKPVPSLLREFSAPVKVNYHYFNSDLAWLVQCDSDPFARWDAQQQFALNTIKDLVKQNENDDRKIDPLFIEIFSTLLSKPTNDLNFLSRLLILPSEQYLLANLPGIDILSIHLAREFCKKQLAKELEDHWLSQYENNTIKKSYKYNIEDMGKRNMQAVSLAYLVATQKSDHKKLAYQQFAKADNMTTSMSALSALNNYECDERDKALAEFYQRWQKEPLVVNKWLMLQSTSILPNTLDRVKALLTHPAYSQSNPNNVYSLIVGFGANVSRFHDSDGEGYQFIADQVLAIDPENPQVAARVIQPLTRWEQMDTTRAKLMQDQLQRIAKVSGLSPDIYEVVHKSLPQ